MKKYLLLGVTAAAAVHVLLFPTIATAGPLEDAEAAYSRGDYSTAFRLYAPLADQGLPEAQTALGNLYQKRHDYADSLIWFRKAADQGDVPAHLSLGLIYLFGLGVPKDSAEALKFLRVASSQGDVRVQKMISELEDDGYVRPSDLQAPLAEAPPQLAHPSETASSTDSSSPPSFAAQIHELASNPGIFQQKCAELNNISDNHLTVLAAESGNTDAYIAWLTKYRHALPGYDVVISSFSFNDPKGLNIPPEDAFAVAGLISCVHTKDNIRGYSQDLYISAAVQGYVPAMRALGDEAAGYWHGAFWENKLAEQGDLEARYKVAQSLERMASKQQPLFAPKDDILFSRDYSHYYDAQGLYQIFRRYSKNNPMPQNEILAAALNDYNIVARSPGRYQQLANVDAARISASVKYESSNLAAANGDPDKDGIFHHKNWNTSGKVVQILPARDPKWSEVDGGTVNTSQRTANLYRYDDREIPTSSLPVIATLGEGNLVCVDGSPGTVGGFSMYHKYEYGARRNIVAVFLPDGRTEGLIDGRIVGDYGEDISCSDLYKQFNAGLVDKSGNITAKGKLQERLAEEARQKELARQEIEARKAAAARVAFLLTPTGQKQCHADCESTKNTCERQNGSAPLVGAMAGAAMEDDGLGAMVGEMSKKNCSANFGQCIAQCKP